MMAKERIKKEVLTRNLVNYVNVKRQCKVVLGSDVFVSGVRL